MEFFDKKEEVLEIKLTPFGQYKLSQGALKPAYYAFFDEGIIYDSAKAGFVEKQNEAELRIQDNTPSLKALNVFSGIETSQAINAAIVRERVRSAVAAGWFQEEKLATDPLYSNPGAVWNTEELQYPADRAVFLSRPLGSSKLSADKQPAWWLSAHQGQLSSSSPQFYSSAGFEEIPQININIEYNTYVEEIPGITAASSGLQEDLTLTKAHEANSLEAITSPFFNDMRIVVNRNDLVLEVREEHTDFQKENFEIEVFLSGSDYPGGLKQLYFNGDSERTYTPDDVEYYLTVNHDNEINADLMQKLKIKDFTALGQDPGSGIVSTKEYFIKDVYGPGEKCD